MIAAATHPAAGADRWSVWVRENQRHLVLAAEAAAASLEGREADAAVARAAAAELAADALRTIGEPLALDRLAALFSLTAFERDLLIATAAPELGMPAAEGAVTFARALAGLPDPHWSALLPGSPLRGWRLLDVPTQLPPAEFGGLSELPLAVDERVLHALLGADAVDERLAGRCRLITPLCLLSGGQRDAVRTLALQLRPEAEPESVVVSGQDASTRAQAVLEAAGGLGLSLLAVDGSALPEDATRLDSLSRLLAREAGLGQRLLMVEAAAEAPDAALRLLRNPAQQGVPRVLSIDDSPDDATPEVRMPAPIEAERIELFADALDGVGLRADPVRLSELGVLTSAEIARTVVHAARTGATTTDEVLELGRRSAGRRLGELAVVRRPQVRVDDLVLTDAADRSLRALLAHVRQRRRVHDEWGWAERERGLAVTALFAGPSGTGKTTAAEAIATELGVELVTAELSRVMSKYIGDTPKHIGRLFDAAESGAVLLFDEGDALFGKRTQVRDSHDRYANLEVAYLLQRLEAFRGIAILTTNARDAIDPAFLRRMRFVVTFPFPDAGQRARIWRTAFPPGVPTEGLDIARLAQLAVSGGTIAQLAVQAAFLAADAGASVGMAHVLEAARIECDKLERPLSAAEIRGWVT